MKLHTLNTGFFKLDGGAMFGVVPKQLWQRTNPADENNLCTWAMRSLLIEDGDRLILVDTGIGNKQDDKFFSHYHLHGTDSLDGNLKALGFQRSDITDVFLTHMHFDHVGGAVERTEPVPERPNARGGPRAVHRVRHVRTICRTTRVDPAPSKRGGDVQLLVFVHGLVRV